MMIKDEKIYVAGHTGLIGSAIVRELTNRGFHNIVTRTHPQLELMNRHWVREFFIIERPRYVFIAAATVGGIMANLHQPAEFIYENLAIHTNLIHEAWRAGVHRLLFLGSSCIYPKDASQPIKEEYLLTGSLEWTNRPYAIAKIAGVEMCSAYNRQYNTQFIAAMPTNSYGPKDNYDVGSSHVIPGLIRKFHEAKINKRDTVSIWGTGSPFREFLYSDDVASACIFLMNLDDVLFAKMQPLINIGSGEEYTINSIAKLIKAIVGFEGNITYDYTKPNGTFRKLIDTSKLRLLGWKPTIDIEEGIQKAYRDFKRRYDT